MNNNYENSVHRLGRIGIVIAMTFMLVIPAIISAAYDVWPASLGQVLSVGGGLLAVFIPTTIAEVFSYTPLLGSSAYIAFLTGNVMNLKIPVVVNAQQITGISGGTEEGDVIASIGVATSSIVTTVLISISVILLVPLQPILTSPVVRTATTYLLPSLFGGIFLSFVNNDCGEYVAKGKPLVMILPLAMVFLLNSMIKLSGLEGFIVLICMGLTVLSALVLYKTGVIKMTPKKKPVPAESQAADSSSN